MAQKLYTRTGDKGETGLYGAERVRKDSARVEAYGTVDEVNSVLGLVRSLMPSDNMADIMELLAKVQNALLDVGADLATRIGSGYEGNITRINSEDVADLEGSIDLYTEETAPFNGFVHPGGHPAAAALHIARSTVRRAERRVVQLAEAEKVNPKVLSYLNRLSDLFWVVALVINARQGVKEEGWLVGNRS